MAIFNSYVTNYQRVYPIIIPLFTIVNPLLNHYINHIKSPFHIELNLLYHVVQCEAPVRQRSVGANNSNVTMVYGMQITIVTGANLNQLISWGPRIVGFQSFFVDSMFLVASMMMMMIIIILRVFFHDLTLCCFMIVYD